VFGRIGNLQIGVTVPEALAGVDRDITFRIDKPAIVPEPGTLAILTIGALVLLRRRRGGEWTMGGGVR
jgi:hypothetical protein